MNDKPARLLKQFELRGTYSIQMEMPETVDDDDEGAAMRAWQALSLEERDTRISLDPPDTYYVDFLPDN